MRTQVARALKVGVQAIGIPFMVACFGGSLGGCASDAKSDGATGQTQAWTAPDPDSDDSNPARVNRQTFLFVHGLWHGSWVWDEPVRRVQGAGHRAVTMDLQGRAGDPTPAATITLASQAAAICTVLQGLSGHDDDHKTILVGHSMTGVYISQAAENCPQYVKKLVYMSAFLPQNGESGFQLVGIMEQAFGGTNVGSHLDFQFPYAFFIPNTPVGSIFYGDCPPSIVARNSAMLTPEPIAPLPQPVTLTATNWGSIPKDYISFTDDQAIPVAFQAFMYQRVTGIHVTSMHGSHTHWLSDPGAVAQALVAPYGGTVDLSPPPAPLSALEQ